MVCKSICVCYCVCLYETLVYSFVGVEWTVYFDLRLHIHPRLNIAAHVNQGRQETEKLINSRKHSLHSHGDEPVRRIIGNSYCHAGLLTNWQLHPTSVMQCTLVQTKQAIRRSCSSYFCELRTHKGETRKQNWAGCCSIPFVCDTFVEWQAAAICYASKAGFQDLSAKGIQSHPLNHTPDQCCKWCCPGNTQKNSAKRNCYNTVSRVRCWSTQKNPPIDGEAAAFSAIAT